MTLRQKIAVTIFLARNNNNEISEKHADDILKLFEKLIDEKIEDVRLTYKSSQDTDRLIEKRQYQIRILQELKEELEK